MGQLNTIYGIISDGNIVYPEPTAPYFADEKWAEIVDAWDANFELPGL